MEEEKPGNHMQMVESLGLEIKSLKKKFTLCSQELTKCYKSLEYEKAKSAQFESTMNQIAEENYRLREMVKNMSKPDSVLKREELKIENMQNLQSSSLVESERIPIPVKKSTRRESYDESVSALKDTRKLI